MGHTGLFPVDRAVGLLPGDKEGFYGNVTGFDFCERNYYVTYYIGELWCSCTNFMSLPVYLIIAYYVRSKGARMLPLTWFYIALAFADMFTAGMSHATLKVQWTSAQIAVLELMYIFFFAVIFLRYHQDQSPWKICRIIILTIVALRVVEGALDVIMGFEARPAWATGFGNFALISMLVGTVVSVALARDAIPRLLFLQVALLVPAFALFAITDVHSGNCLDLPAWLHEFGHTAGAFADYFSLLVVIGLDSEVQKTLHLGVHFKFFPGLVSNKGSDDVHSEAGGSVNATSLQPLQP